MTDAKRRKGPKRWSYSAGERGRNRVRAFEHTETGRLFLEFVEPTRLTGRPRVKRVALGHRDRDLAKAATEKLVSELRQATPPEPAHITLGTLFDNYLSEVTPRKGAGKQTHDHLCAELFLRAFGRDRQARTLSRREWDRFIADRRTGVLRPFTVERRRPVGDRVVAYDLKWLLACLSWATVVSNGRGGTLLDRNPLKGLSLPKEESPARPALNGEDYRAMLHVAGDVSPFCQLALVLARETGHRIGAVRQLRWSDIDLDRNAIHWAKQSDKIGMQHETPMSDAAHAALQAARIEQKVIGDAWVFPAPGDGTQPCSRHLLRDWWERAATKAKLPKVKSRGWHSLRRQFATELKSVPLADLAALGGWKDPQTILKCYMRPDQATMRAALANRRPIERTDKQLDLGV